jgi:membrane peptidoglycan carboxypeptidase
MALAGLLVATAIGVTAVPAVLRARGVDVAALERPAPSDTVVTDRTGTVVLARLHPDGRHHLEAPLSAMGRWLPAATVAVDDPGFWTEPVADPRPGRSHIVRRLVRLRLLGGDGSTGARIEEVALAAEAERRYSRSQVLEWYLNAAPYGNDADGAETAAERYFDVPAARLDLAQAALLAGLPAEPTLYDPLRHFPAAQRRQREVLDAMVAGGAVSRAEADRAAGEALDLRGSAEPNRAPDFVARAAAAAAAGTRVRDLGTAGLRIVTTLDWDLQQRAEQALRDGLQASRPRGVANGAMVAVDPRTGEVLALVGSADRQAPNGDQDLTAWPPRNSGTASRLFTYAAAIASRRYTAATPVPDTPVTLDMEGGPPYRPRNFDLRYHGTCPLQACLADGLNVPAVEVEMGMGIPVVVGMARTLGAPPLQPHFQPNGSLRYTTDDAAATFGPALTLGGYGQTPMQLAAATSALAAGGVLTPPSFVRSVGAGGRAGRPAPATPGRRVLDAGTAFVVSQMLADDDSRAMIFGRGSPLALAGRRAAALTGTTDIYTDAWALGYTPSLAAVVWMGNPDRRPMTVGSDAVFVAAPVWNRFMQGSLDRLGRGDEWYQPPAGVHEAPAGGRTAWFLNGTAPDTPAPALPGTVHVG